MNANTSTIIMLLLDNGILWMGVPHISREYEDRLDDRGTFYWHVLVQKPAGVSNDISSVGVKLLTFQNFNVCNIEIWDDIVNPSHVF